MGVGVMLIVSPVLTAFGLSRRVYLVTWFLLVFVLPVLCLFEPIFLMFKIEPEVAHIAAKYMRIAAWGVPVSVERLRDA